MSTKKRNEIASEYQWDLGSLYASDDAWNADFSKLKDQLTQVKGLQGSVMETPENLQKTIELNLETGRTMEKLYTYAKMSQDQDTRVSAYQGMTSKAESLAVELGGATSFIVPEILAADVATVNDYMNNFEGLNLYKQHMDDILRRKPYTKTAAEEAILAQAGELAAAPQNIFGMLNAADLKFPTIKGAEGEDITLTHGNFVPTLESRDRRVRKDAFEAYYSVFEGHKNSLAMMTQSEVKKNTFLSKVRGHESARHASLFENNVDVQVYDSLVDAVHEALPAMHKYMEIRKRALELEELHMYDVYTPIVKNVDMTIPYDEAKGIVMESLKPLGEKYLEVVEKSFKDGWIDVYENEGKRSGAYSWGTYDSKPYILLNHHDTLDNMFTLTHEMGHSMHSYLTHEKQPYVYGNYSIFLAEVASTTNEALLNHHMLETITDKEQRLFLLNHYLETFRGTVFRQTMFAEFERDIHTIVESGEALTADTLCAHYRKLNQEYYGPHMNIDEQIDMEWGRIPHFYYNFYVFQYATGFSAAVALSEAILKEGQPAVDRYLNFLSAGCSEYPLDIMAKAGADMRTGQPVRDALKVFAKLVDEMEALLFE